MDERLVRLALLRRTGQYDPAMIDAAEQQLKASGAKSGSEDKKRNGWLDFGLTTAGSSAGVAGGAAAGAAIGSVVPIIGTAIGGGIGAILGGALGGAGGQMASNALQERAIKEGVGREAFFGGLGGVGKAVKAIKGVKVASEVLSATDEAAKAASGATKVGKAVEATTDAAKAADMGVLSGITKRAEETPARLFASSFTVPTKLARRLKPVETAQEILDHGLAGKTTDELRGVVSAVTGGDGMMSRAVRDGLGLIEGDVKMDKVLTSARNMLDEVPELTSKEKANILSTIVNAQKPGVLPDYMNPLDAFDSIQKLEKIGYRYYNAGTNYLSGNPKATGIGEAFLAAADEMKMALDGVIEKNGIIDAVRTPELVQAAQNISPRLAQQLSEAKNMTDLRKIQAPFVRLGNMIDLTEEASNSTFGKVAKGMQNANRTGVVQTLLRGPRAAADMILNAPLGEASDTLTRKTAAGLQKGVDVLKGTGGKLPSVNIPGGASVLPFNIGVQSIDQLTKPQDASAMADMGVLGDLQPPDVMMTGGNDAGVTSNGFTPELLQQLMLDDLASTGGKNAEWLQNYYKMANPQAEMSSSQQQAVAQQENALSALDQLERLYKDAGGGSLPGVGRLKKVTNNANASTYDAYRLAIASTIARALGEKGAMSNADIERYIQMFPNLSERGGSANKKFQVLRQRLQNAALVANDNGSDMGVLTGMEQ